MIIRKVLFPSGLPVPYSVEVSGLSAMTAFLHGPASSDPEDTLAMVEFGGRVSFFAIFRKTVPIMIRKFEFGSDTILEKVQKSLGIDRNTAEGIVSDGSFDISQQISEVMDGFIKQVIVSRDFVERRENCQVSRVFASGGITCSSRRPTWSRCGLRNSITASCSKNVRTWTSPATIRDPMSRNLLSTGGASRQPNSRTRP